MDCVSEGEHAAAAASGLVVVWGVGQGFFLFDGNIAKLCGIKDFSAGLALNEFGVFLSGDDFDDRMFADGGHVGGVVRMVWILPVPSHVVNCVSYRFRGENVWMYW
jgi:hypothetical protein